MIYCIESFIYRKYQKKFSYLQSNTNTAMKTSIHFERMHFYAFHGVEPQEQVVGNNFSIDLILYVPFEAAMRSDSLSNTINYAQIHREISVIMATPSRLLENVAGRIITALQTRFPKIKGGKIGIYKENPPITGEIDRVGVVVEW